jgi:hypothetical protein
MPELPFIEKACNSRSTARRAYDHYIKRIAAKKTSGFSGLRFSRIFYSAPYLTLREHCQWLAAT